MRKIPSVLFTAIFLFSLTSFAGQPYPLQEYELLVLESLPEAMSLDMTLSEIEKTKENSRLGSLKRRLNKTVFKKIAPLLASTDFSAGFNMLQIPKLLPLKDIVNDLNLGNKDGKANPPPADFIIVIAPKLPVQFGATTENPYARLYPTNKASVASFLDIRADGLMSYEEILNKRMMEGAEFLFQRQYSNGTLKQGFFAGALISIHAEGTNSYAKAKIAIGLPTDQTLPFEQQNDQIKLTQLMFPRAPYNGYITKMDNPIAMASIEHYVTGANPLVMKMAFGTLGPMAERNWGIGSAPSDSVVSRWFSWMDPYNVPHFRGEIRSVVAKEMLGGYETPTNWVNSFLSWGFDIQLNLHEVVIDLQKIEITDVTMTVDLPWKGASEFLPTFHLADPEEQFKNEGNKVLKEQKDKVEGILNNGLLILNDENAQKMLFDTLDKLLANKGAQQ